MQLGREARADWVEVLVRETMARKVTAVAINDHHDGCGDLVLAAAKRPDTPRLRSIEITCKDDAQCIAIFDRHAVELYLAMR